MHPNTQVDWAEKNLNSDISDLWQLYEHRTKYSPLPLVVTEGPHHIVCYANPAFCALTKRNPQELKGVPFNLTLPEGERHEFLALLDRVLTAGATDSASEQISSGGNQSPHCWAYSVWAVLEEGDCPPGLMIQVMDLSKVLQTYQRGKEIGEALMLLSVKQLELAEGAEMARDRLELAMHEAEHRAKNSLQTISSRLSIQLRANPAAVPSLELNKLQMHIKTIAAMHDLLTFVKSDMPIAQSTSIKEMLERLLPLWQTIMGPGHFEWSCDDLQMSIKQCASLATIINELVCNSVKHGSKSVVLGLAATGGMAKLEIKDDGHGFPKDFRLEESTKFGLKFVRSIISSELEGTLAYGNLSQGGAVVTITFPVSESYCVAAELFQ
jgi:two-component sensor histidine kinase